MAGGWIFTKPEEVSEWMKLWLMFIYSPAVWTNLTGPFVPRLSNKHNESLITQHNGTPESLIMWFHIKSFPDNVE